MTAADREPGAVVARMAPVQGYSPGIPWELHLEAYDAYCKRYSKQQALIEGGCRGGFGTSELDEFIPGWRDRVTEYGAMKRRIAELTTENEAMRARAEAAEANELNAVIESAAKNLPDGYEIRVCVERGAGWVALFDREGDEVELDDADLSMPAKVRVAIGEAIAEQERGG